MPVCPSCGREVGSRVTCPYCGANLKRRLSIALFGVLAIVLAIGGLALLYVVSINTTIPTIRIAQIQAAMNYATVRIAGLVKRSPNFNSDSESLTFWVDDGSGQMLVAAFRSEARALIETDRVPAIGDRVSVEGTLRVRDDTPSLTIAAVDSLRLSRATDSALPRDLGAITPDETLTGVTVRGQVRAVREPRSSGSLRLITLRDATGEIDVVIDADIAAFGAPAPDVAIGDSIAVTGVVTLFEGAPQITLTRGERLSRLSEPVAIAELRPIRGLGDDDIGRWVHVQGAITRIAPFSAGVKFTLSDAQGQDVSLLLWDDVFESLPDAADWQIGAQVAAQGQINSFRGELELVPEIAFDVSILVRAVAEAPPTLNLTRIGTITQGDVGRSVFVSGTIQSVDRFSAGVRFQLEDDTGSIHLVLFGDVYDQVDNGDRLEEGTSVSALGRVSEFNGELEVVPPNGASVRVALGAAIAAAQVTPTPELPRATLTPTPPDATPTPSATLTAAPTAVLSVTAVLTGTLTSTPEATPAPTAIATATPTASATLELTSTGVTAIGSIDGSRLGQTVTARGQVIATSSFSAGFRFTLNDGTGSIPLVLFDGRYREVADRAALNLGAQVAVTATVVEFNGELEVQPTSGRDVVVERPGSSSIVKTRAINTLSGADVGTLAAVVGDVLRVEGFGSPQVGVSVFVNDGTAELRVVMWNNVLNFVPNALALQPGVKVRVAGQIDEFNGVLELVPALGYDVAINP